ncbi:hypothetical protein J6S35_02870 [Candidatus Saccharibacteria bacterium]|nr:hypothetical protein [Candidatus Saccharibacteria bacterium]
MSKSTKIIAALGVVAGLGVAALPAFTYAAETDGEVEIMVEIQPAIAMTITGNEDDGTHSAPTYVKVTPNADQTQNPQNPSALGWYEYDSATNTYTLSEDTTVSVGKEYIVKTTSPSYHGVDNFNPANLASGEEIDGHEIPAAAVVGTSSSYWAMLPNTLVEGDISDTSDPQNSFGSIVTVYTNNATGYNLSVRDADSNTNLSHVTDPTQFIPASGSALTAGTAGWNYDVTRSGLAAIEHQAITAADVVIDTLATKTTDGRTAYVDYNVATAGDQATGIYADTIIYTATTINN